VLFMNADGTVKAHQKISETAGGFTGLLNPGLVRRLTSAQPGQRGDAYVSITP